MATTSACPWAGARAAFTAVELMMVMGIMLIIMSITVPSILPTLRHSKLTSAYGDIEACWRLARSMAMSSSVPVGLLPAHYGILISQTTGQQVTVTLVYDNVAVAPNTSPKTLVQGQDTSDPTTYNSANPPVAKYTFNRNVVLATSSSTSGPATVGNVNILIYAQYGTGLPLNPTDISLGRGLVASSTSMGISGMLATALGAPAMTSPPPSVMPITELQTVDFVSAPRRGFCMAIGLYNAGFMSAEDL
jgi:Tfp pilus assembly protein FimT